MSAPAIRTESLTKRYRPGDPAAVDGLDLSVAAGELHGLLGANGSGKSTTVGMLATLVAPTAGRAEVAGLDVVARPAEVRRRIGVALQEAGVDPLATPRELLELHGGLLGLGGEAARRRAGELLDALGLAANAGAPLRTLSGGTRRRVDLALALVGQPEVVFLDEPTTGLDPLARRSVWEQVAALRDAGTAVLLTTQYLEEADRLADRVSILAAGRLVAGGTPAELKRRAGGAVLTVEVEPGAQAAAVAALSGRADGEQRVALPVEDGGGAVPRVLASLAAAGIDARSIALAQPTLDDVFAQTVATATDPQEIAA